MGVVAVILAAGSGSRMKSTLPKVLHPVCGLPMIEHVCRATEEAGADRLIIVISPGNGEAIRAELGAQGRSNVEFVIQDNPKGTGHAVLCAHEAVGDADKVLVLAGDTPLLTAETLRSLVDLQQTTGAAASLAAFRAPLPNAYGRVVRDGAGVSAIVEASDLGDDPTLNAVDEFNAAVYCFEAVFLWPLLGQLTPKGSKNELYLTDVIGLLRQGGHQVVAPEPFEEEEFLGVNDRWALAEAARYMRTRILRKLAEGGVTIIDPASTFVGADVTCGQDVTIEPNCTLEGKTTIGAGSSIGPNTWVKDAQIGRNVRLFMSHVDQAEIHDNVRCGPFANLRPKAVLKAGVKVGNFVEVKNSVLEEGVSASHLTYIGDAVVGANSNIGAGTITCNYDGFDKHRTEIGSGSFIGSNSTLVAPLKIADGSFVAAGSVITKDVPEGALALGRAKQETKEGWVARWKASKSRGSS